MFDLIVCAKLPTSIKVSMHNKCHYSFQFTIHYARHWWKNYRYFYINKSLFIELYLFLIQSRILLNNLTLIFFFFCLVQIILRQYLIIVNDLMHLQYYFQCYINGIACVSTIHLFNITAVKCSTGIPVYFL